MKQLKYKIHDPLVRRWGSTRPVDMLVTKTERLVAKQGVGPGLVVVRSLSAAQLCW